MGINIPNFDVDDNDDDIDEGDLLNELESFEHGTDSSRNKRAKAPAKKAGLFPSPNSAEDGL